MSKISKMEIELQGDEDFAELMAALSELSNAQERFLQMFSDKAGRVADDAYQLPTNKILNHAKYHIVNVMQRIHKQRNLPGELTMFGEVPEGHGEED
jgi:hypothetical protein